LVCVTSFIPGLFNDADCSLDFMGLNDRIFSGKELRGTEFF